MRSDRHMGRDDGAGDLPPAAGRFEFESHCFELFPEARDLRPGGRSDDFIEHGNFDPVAARLRCADGESFYELDRVPSRLVLPGDHRPDLLPGRAAEAGAVEIE